MTLNKELYRRVYEQYRQWNEAEIAGRSRNVRPLSPAEAWRQYADLWEFCRELSPQPGERQREQKLAALERYYARLRKLEAWRRTRGRKYTSTAAPCRLKHGDARVEESLKTSLLKAITFLEEHGYRYAIIGGIALAQWGVIRVTRNVDKVLVPDTDYDAVRAALQAAFPARSPWRPIENPFIVSVVIGSVIVDFLLALPGYEELVIERAVQRDLDGWSAWFCSVEDLIIQKVVAGRGKDWLDVEMLLAERWDKLDETYIQDWLTQFAEALEKPKVLTEYQRLLAKIKLAQGGAS